MANPQVVRAIRERIAVNPKASQRAILADLRSQGYKISNEIGRTIINLNRAQVAEQIEDNIRGVAPRLFRTPSIISERELANFSNKQAEQLLRRTIRANETFITNRKGTSRVTNFRYARITYSATAQVSIFLEGRLYEKRSVTYEGMFTQDVKGFTQELVAERVKQQLEGRVSMEIGNQTGLGTGSVINGLTVTIDDIQIDFRQIEPRG